MCERCGKRPAKNKTCYRCNQTLKYHREGGRPRGRAVDGVCSRCGNERPVLNGMCQRCRYSVKEGRVARGSKEHKQRMKEFGDRQRGARNHGWKGGRTIDSAGYVWVLVDSGDRIATAMKTSGTKGYIQEHRLVMAKALGRPLFPWETVHHVNTQRDDNRLENLQLRIGRHGGGGVFQCRTCGSHDVVPVPLGDADRSEAGN
jgi:HNH endonuclease